jgi:hypothetical protein
VVLARDDLRAGARRAAVFFCDLGNFFVGEGIGCPQNFLAAGVPLYGGQ